jgi:hypothetical protein
VSAPSFDRLLRQARRWPADHPAWTHDRKLAGRALAGRLGIRVPTLLSGPSFLARLDPPDPGRSAVLKPDAGSTGRAVLLLRPVVGGYALPDGTVRTWPEVLDLARQAADGNERRRVHDQIHGPWFVEASATPDGSPPISYRLHTFRRGVELVTAGHNPAVVGGDKRVNAWDPRDLWRQVHPWARTKAAVDTSLPRPVNGEAMIAAARRYLAAVGTAYMRVDFYEDSQGLLFAEQTPVPTWGRTRHVPEWDRRMGAAWLRS